MILINGDQINQTMSDQINHAMLDEYLLDHFDKKTSRQASRRTMFSGLAKSCHAEMLKLDIVGNKIAKFIQSFILW